MKRKERERGRTAQSLVIFRRVWLWKRKYQKIRRASMSSLIRFRHWPVAKVVEYNLTEFEYILCQLKI